MGTENSSYSDYRYPTLFSPINHKKSEDSGKNNKTAASDICRLLQFN